MLEMGAVGDFLANDHFHIYAYIMLRIFFDVQGVIIFRLPGLTFN